MKNIFISILALSAIANTASAIELKKSTVSKYRSIYVGTDSNGEKCNISVYEGMTKEGQRDFLGNTICNTAFTVGMNFDGHHALPASAIQCLIKNASDWNENNEIDKTVKQRYIEDGTLEFRKPLFSTRVIGSEGVLTDLEFKRHKLLLPSSQEPTWSCNDLKMVVRKETKAYFENFAVKNERGREVRTARLYCSKESAKDGTSTQNGTVYTKFSYMDLTVPFSGDSNAIIERKEYSTSEEGDLLLEECKERVIKEFKALPKYNWQ